MRYSICVRARPTSSKRKSCQRGGRPCRWFLLCFSKFGGSRWRERPPAATIFVPFPSPAAPAEANALRTTFQVESSPLWTPSTWKSKRRQLWKLSLKAWILQNSPSQCVARSHCVSLSSPLTFFLANQVKEISAKWELLPAFLAVKGEWGLDCVSPPFLDVPLTVVYFLRVGQAAFGQLQPLCRRRLAQHR